MTGDGFYNPVPFLAGELAAQYHFPGLAARSGAEPIASVFGQLENL
jgi:hypothetical protein